MRDALIIGGGIGGLASALALSRGGIRSHVYEQAPQFAEVGAGLQLGPNAVRRLHALGLASAMSTVAVAPEKLTIRSANSGKTLGELSFGATTIAQYGAPYLSIHRADLHELLLLAATADGADLQAGQTFSHYALPDAQSKNTVIAHFGTGASLESSVLIGADGLRSRVRQHMLNDGAPVKTGHTVFRCLIAQRDLPLVLRSQHITAWLGPALHVVQYPVRGGDVLNVAVIVRTPPEFVTCQDDATQDWGRALPAQTVRAALADMCVPLTALIEALQDWHVWTGYARPPVACANEMAQGRIALLGDAAHPMRPYLAQGAGMAIEDAASLAQAMQAYPSDATQALQHYAQVRWQRNAKVQARAKRNGQIFHAKGVLALGRNVGISLLGKRVLDVPWLYAG